MRENIRHFESRSSLKNTNIENVLRLIFLNSKIIGSRCNLIIILYEILKEIYGYLTNISIGLFLKIVKHYFL